MRHENKNNRETPTFENTGSKRRAWTLSLDTAVPPHRRMQLLIYGFRSSLSPVPSARLAAVVKPFPFSFSSRRQGLLSLMQPRPASPSHPRQDRGGGIGVCNTSRWFFRFAGSGVRGSTAQRSSRGNEVKRGGAKHNTTRHGTAQNNSSQSRRAHGGRQWRRVRRCSSGTPRASVDGRVKRRGGWR